mgnify:FL=1
MFLFRILTLQRQLQQLDAQLERMRRLTGRHCCNGDRP